MGDTPFFDQVEEQQSNDEEHTHRWNHKWLEEPQKVDALDDKSGHEVEIVLYGNIADHLVVIDRPLELPDLKFYHVCPFPDIVDEFHSIRRNNQTDTHFQCSCENIY